MSTTLRLSLDEYERMIATGAFDRIDRRIEFIHGEIRQMRPMGPVHGDHIQHLTTWSSRLALDKKVTLQVQIPFHCNDSLPEPDIAWFEPKRYGRQRPTAADTLLVIEVADSSLEYDLGKKAELYASGGIPEYWVIDPRERQLIRHLDPGERRYRTITTHSDTASIAPNRYPQAQLILRDLFLPPESDTE